MTTTTVQRPPRNGVDVPTLFATLDAVKGAPQIAQFQFRATNEWISGTHNRSTIQGFYGAGQEDTSRPVPFTLRRRPPDSPRGIEPRSHAGRVPAACHRRLPHVRPGEHCRRPRHHPAAESPRPSRVTSTCSASSGSPTLFATATGRSGCTSTSTGDASPEQLAALVEQSRRRSAVYDVLVNGTDVQIDVSTP